MAPACDAPLVSEEEVKLYTIHISSKYLNLTKQKLELTRLPHDVPVPQFRKNEWWEPKATVESLVDYWLERYSWREQEAEFNANIPQFRTAIRTQSSDSPVRLHFIHSQSTYANAVPLLLIPPFPLTNLSLTHLISPLISPATPGSDVPFNVVIPSMPGLGFSDPITSHGATIPAIAEMFDTLMTRLGYQYYLATNVAPSPNSVAAIDWQILNRLAAAHGSSCLGLHLVSPVSTPPKFRSSPVQWLKWKAVVTLQTPILGYTEDDVAALRQDAIKANKKLQQRRDPVMTALECLKSNTLAYALCDSPAGILLFILLVLRVLGASSDLDAKQIIQFAELMWLPGPEGAVRLWAQSAATDDHNSRARTSRKPKAAITVFSGAGQRQMNNDQFSVHNKESHTCLAWSKNMYHVVSTQRITGSPGLLAWERPDVITAGVRGLATAITAKDDRLQVTRNPGAALLEQSVVGRVQVSQTKMANTMIKPRETSLLLHQRTDRGDSVKSRYGALDGLKKFRRPSTPRIAMVGGSSEELLRDFRENSNASQSSSGGSLRTIKPVRRS